MASTSTEINQASSTKLSEEAKQLEHTGHPVMIALPNKSWKWCYVHKQYS
jgi:hypothetical protein